MILFDQETRVHAVARATIRKSIERHADSDGWASHSDVLRDANMSAEVFRQIMKRGIEEGVLELGNKGSAICYRIKAASEGKEVWREVGIRTGSAG